MTPFQLFIRGLFLQAGWNRERMQALGFTFSLLPLARRLQPIDEAAFIRRHLAYVNTNPGLAGALLGLVAREEERLRVDQASEEDAATRVAAVKRRFEGPFAAIGDKTFWGSLRPLAGVLGALALFTLLPFRQAGGTSTVWAAAAALASITALLAFYNGPYLAVRARSARSGLEAGGGSGEPEAGVLKGLGLTRLNAMLAFIGPLALGALTGRLLVGEGGRSGGCHRGDPGLGVGGCGPRSLGTAARGRRGALRPTSRAGGNRTPRFPRPRRPTRMSPIVEPVGA
jgi:hypothetical protein